MNKSLECHVRPTRAMATSLNRVDAGDVHVLCPKCHSTEATVVYPIISFSLDCPAWHDARLHRLTHT